MKLIVYTDGASRNNPGKASYGFTISSDKGELIYEEGKYIGLTTNNIAEYRAVLEAFKYIHQNITSAAEIHLFADSRLIIEQLLGNFKVKHPGLKPLFTEIKSLEKFLPKITYTHVLRERNKIADRLANLALDSI